MRRLPLASSLCLAFLTALVLACGGGGGDKPEATPMPTETPAPGAGAAGADAALQRYAETTLQKQFVADCSKADVSRDAGKVCAAFRGDRGNQRAYVIGPTFSEFSQWVILEEKSGQYTVVSITNLNADTAAVPGVPWPLRTGVDVVVAGARPCVNVREGPALNQKAVDCIADGTKIRLTAGPTAADGINWYQVEGRSGWVSGDFLRYADAVN